MDPKRGTRSLRGPSAAMVQEVLQRLLQVALADPERTVQQKLLNEIKPTSTAFFGSRCTSKRSSSS